ncbi:AAA family ATPase [Pseudonocardia sp.]|uniref:AAA family ATPase n=1 Tax=Pseudonocardia sp. TaxID=60912 RepID=UPI003D0D1A27
MSTTPRETPPHDASPVFATSREHLLCELRWLDGLLAQAIRLARAQVDATGAGMSAYVISEAEIDALLDGPGSAPGPPPQADAMRELIALAAEAGTRAGARMRLLELARAFGLSGFDVDVVVACLAPELDRRYERIYGYLHDDLTRRSPNVGLVLDLLCPDEETRWAARARLSTAAPLRRHELVLLEDPPDLPGCPLSSRTARLAPRVAAFLLDDDTPDEQLRDLVEVAAPGGVEPVLPPGPADRLAALAAEPAADLLVHLRGAPGTGRRTVAAALCAAWGSVLLAVRGGRVAAAGAGELAATLRRIDREARLQGALPYWDGVDELRPAERDTVLAALAAHPGPAFVAGSASWEPPEGIEVVRFDVPAPGQAERLRLWAAATAGLDVATDDLAALSGRFRLSGARIRGAVATARGLARARAPRTREVTVADLYAGCRLRSHRALAELAQEITPRHTWEDLVLPPDRTEQLREIVDQVRHRGTVHERWGFGALAGGGGLTVLFAGPSGTGKTMAAGVLAATLGLDLYAVDLSSVVSKYIGETEKHLARVFDEADAGNAVLFFDEADALFGRRTQVRDAHDRYANLETSYLLQRLERHEGLVVLATNLRKNMDEAFVRRLHATVEFPVPDEADRLRIWTRIWPAAAPRDPDLDLAALARDVALPGGSIRNIVLAGAFLAAADGGVVTMEHLMRATGRELAKIGKVGVPGELGGLRTR